MTYIAIHFYTYIYIYTHISLKEKNFVGTKHKLLYNGVYMISVA